MVSAQDLIGLREEMLFNEVFFLLVFHLLDLLKIAAWPSSSLLPSASEPAEAKCDSIMSFKLPNPTVLCY